MKKVLKWIVIVLGSLVGLVLVAAGVLFLMGNARLNKTYKFPPSNLVLPTDEASIEFGKHRVETLCQGCHGEDLGGVADWFDAPPIGKFSAANITAGDDRGEYTTEDYVRAIRHGIDRQGRPLFMPAVLSTSRLSDEDLAAIIAYLKTVPPVKRTLPGRDFAPVGRILLGAGLLGELPAEAVSHEAQVTAPERGVTAEYGEYLVSTNDCPICHGPDLNGGPFPDPTIKKISPNLTPGGELAFWTEEDFINTIRTGTTPSGHKLDPELMPWPSISKLYDEELQAMWLYLQSLPKLPQYSE